MVKRLTESKMVEYDYCPELSRYTLVPTKRGARFCRFDHSIGAFVWSRTVMKFLKVAA